MSFSSPLDGLFSKKNVKEMKDKALEIKEEVVQKLPDQLRYKAPIERRSSHKVMNPDDRRAGFFALDLNNSTPATMETRSTAKTAEPVVKADPLAEMRLQLSEYENKEKSSTQENARLVKERDDLRSKYESDEKAIKTFEKEEQRLKTLIQVEQRKCFDLTQQSVQLRSKIRELEESSKKSTTEIKPAEIKTAKKSKSSKKTNTSSKPSEAEIAADLKQTEAELEKIDPIHHPHGWHSAPQSHFTEMVAKAQQEEMEHGKTFAETLKESIKPSTAQTESSKKDEFLVVGGYDSNHHLSMNPVSAK